MLVQNTSFLAIACPRAPQIILLIQYKDNASAVIRHVEHVQDQISITVHSALI